MFHLKVVAASIAAAFVLGGAASAATLNGSTVSGAYYFPDAGSVYGNSITLPGTFIIGAGIESVIDVETVTQIAVDFSARSLLLNFTTSLINPIWNSFAQNGPIFTILSGNGFGRVTSVSVSSGGSVTADVSGGKLTVNLAGLRYETGDTIQINLAPVPLPAAMPLMLIGIAGFGTLARRKRLA